VPTILSVTLFGEIPGVLQIVGLVLALAAILVLQGKGGEASKHFVLLIALLLVGGLADTMSKFFEEWGTQSLQNQFLLYIFATAFVLCLVLCVVRKQRFSPYDFLFGLVIGIPNYLSSRFLLLSLGQVSAILAYPMFSVGTILAVAILGALLFKERLNRRKLLSLGMILAALVLLNL